jgi:cold shock CspA family protein
LERDLGSVTTAPTEELPLRHGRVVRIYLDQGYGFVELTDGRELFFHRTGCCGDFRRLHVGEHVCCREQAAADGPRGVEVAPEP